MTAVFAANDQRAAGVLRAAAELGRRVPDEVSVVGYDDAEVAGFLEKLDWSTRLLAPELVIRSSTAPPA